VRVGDTLRETFRLWFRTAPAVIPAALVIFLPLEVAAALFEPANDVWPNLGLYSAIFVGTSVVATPWAAGAIVRYHHDGGSALGAYGKLEGALKGLVLGSWLAGIATIAGLVLLVVPGLILAARWSLLVPAAALEQRGPLESLRRSNRLVEDATGRTLAVMVVALLAGFALFLVPALAAEVASPGFVASLVLNLSFDLVVIPLVATAIYVLYRQRVAAGSGSETDDSMAATT
jgi:hypothetical protein